MDINFGSSGGKFVYKDWYSGGVANSDEWYARNGVDKELAHRFRPQVSGGIPTTAAGVWEQFMSVEKQTLEFYNSLTEDELDKLTHVSIGGGDGGPKIGTYRQARELLTARMALVERARELVSSVRDINDSSDPIAAEYNNVSQLVTAVSRNMENALALAKAYLHGLREPKDSITLSADALKKLFDDARAAPPERPEPGTA